MKTVIISDTHLGKKFNNRKFLYLKKLFKSADEIILNGDFWDDSKCSFDEFVHSEWNQLFRFMKFKTIYLHGNHDLETKSDDRVHLFCKQVVKKYLFTLPNKTSLVIVHGHEQSFVSKLVYFFFSNHPRLLYYILYPIDRLQKFQMYLSKKGYSFVNAVNKGYYRQQKDKEDWLVTGHTHMSELNLKNRYINTGFVDDNFASYLTIEDNSIKLIKE